MLRQNLQKYDEFEKIFLSDFSRLLEDAKKYF